MERIVGLSEIARQDGPKKRAIEHQTAENGRQIEKNSGCDQGFDWG
jgi:hypothetical protein